MELLFFVCLFVHPSANGIFKAERDIYPNISV